MNHVPDFTFFFIIILAAECGDDEECVSIKECQEYKYILTRNYEKLRGLKVCGIYYLTVNITEQVCPPFCERDC